MSDNVKRDNGGAVRTRRLVVRARLPDEGSSYGYVLSFGPHVEVLGPASVRDKIKEAAKGIYDSYV